MNRRVRTQRTRQKRQQVPIGMEVLQQRSIREIGARTTPEHDKMESLASG